MEYVSASPDTNYTSDFTLTNVVVDAFISSGHVVTFTPPVHTSPPFSFEYNIEIDSETENWLVIRTILGIKLSSIHYQSCRWNP
jgi:hypothetical protein